MEDRDDIGDAGESGTEAPLKRVGGLPPWPRDKEDAEEEVSDS
jgi:hypothetical protein